MRRLRPAALAMAIGAVLAACSAPTGDLGGARDRSVPISSTTRGSPSDLAGDWVVELADVDSAMPTVGSTVTLSPSGTGGWRWSMVGRSGPVRFETVPGMSGRFDHRDGSFWVLWVDDTFRTAAIGTPDGSVGWVMSRPGRAGQDRTRAALDVLEFNGYTISRLVSAE